MVESPQPNSDASLESLKRDVDSAMSVIMNSAGPTAGPTAGSGESGVYSSVLPAAIASGVGLNKSISAFTEIYGNDGKKPTGNKKANVVKKNVMPKGGISYFDRRIQAAPPALKGGKPDFRSKLANPTFLEQLEIRKRAMGPGSFQPKGVKVKPNIIKSMAELKKIRDLIEKMQKNPLSNPNGTVNPARFIRELINGNDGAEKALQIFKAKEIGNSQLFRGPVLGGPPGTAS